MAERYVRMNILSSGGEKAKATLDDLAARARALEYESPDLKITADDSDATKKIKDLQLKMAILDRERYEIELKTRGDEKVKSQILDIKAKLRDLSEHTADPKVGLRDADKTEASLIRIKLLMDSIHNKRIDVKVAESAGEGSWLARLGRSANKSILGIPKGAGGEGEGGSGFAGLLNGSPGEFLTNPLVGGPLAGLIAGLIPSVAGFGVGGLVGVGGVGLSALIASQSAAAIKLDQGALKAAKTKAQKAQANATLTADTKVDAPFINLTAGFKELLVPLAGILSPFAKALGPLIQQLLRFEEVAGPQMSKMFMASIPFLKAFLEFLEQGGRALIPSFTLAMNTMVKSGALKQMTQALVLLITDGLVPFLRILGPGMRDSAVLFKAVILSLDGVLIGIAAIATFTAREFVLVGHAITDVGKVFYDFGRVIAALVTGNWKAMGNAVGALGRNFRNFFATLGGMLTDGFGKISSFGHDVAHVFDMIRHDVAPIWNAFWRDTIGAVINFEEADANAMAKLRHNIASTFDGIRHDISSIWDSTWGPLAHAYDNFKHALLTAIDSTTHLISAVWRQFWEATVGSWLKKGFDIMTGLTDTFRHNLSAGFMEIGHDIRAVWDALWLAVELTLRTKFDALEGLAESFSHILDRIVDVLRHDISVIWDDMWNALFNRANSGKGKVNGVFNDMWKGIRTGFNDIKNWIHNTWNSIWSGVEGAARNAMSTISTILKRLESAFGNPISFVVNHALDPLVNIWDKIVGAIGQKNLAFHLPAFHFATGGIVPGSGKGDKVLSALEPGERVLSNAQVSRAGGHGVLDAMFGRGTGGPFGFAGGGIIPNPLTAVGGFFKNIGKDVLGWVGKGAGFITSHAFGSIESLVGHIPGGTGIASMLSGMVKTLVSDAVRGVVKGISTFGSGKYSGHYGSGVAQWKGDVLKALSMEHLPAFLAGRVLYQMQTESGGNPNAINLTDSNAAAGDPSRGLLQTIMSTFRAYHWPGTSFDIYNPLANIAAAINYARHVYGPDLMRGGMGMGSGHGYANGGWITEPIVGTGLRSGHAYSFGEHGFEYVSPAGRGRGSSGGGDTYYISVMGDTDPDGAALRIHQKLRAYKKRKGNIPLGLA